MARRSESTSTSAFGTGRREAHDASAFYQRFAPPLLSDADDVERPQALLDKLGRGQVFVGDSANMDELPDNSVALVVTSPPYFVGKDYELEVSASHVPTTYVEFLDMLRAVFAECVRVLEPGGRIAVNVANLGRKPYRSLSADVITILQDDLGLLLRGEVIWEKGNASSGSCAWGSFARASNPVFRDMTERVIVASKGRFQRAKSGPERRKAGLPHRSTLSNDEFLEVTRDVWRIDAESASRIGHPAPFPVELPRRLIDLYTYEGDIVLDPFAGSGTTLVAAARTGRIGVGYDTDADYTELAESRLAREFDRLARTTSAESVPDLAGLSIDERQDMYHAMAVEEGRKVQDIAQRCLEAAGFDVRPGGKHPSGLVEFEFLVTGAGGAKWWVDVAGGFTAAKPGLQRSEAVWRLLGRLSVLRASGSGKHPVLVLTSNLPRPGSAVDKTLRAVDDGVLFDAIELYDPAGQERLARYAKSKAAKPRRRPGFWP